MQLLTVLCLILFSCVAGTVGARLLLLSRRTGALPERLLGTAYLSASALGYPILIAAGALAPSSPELARWVHHVGSFGVQFGIAYLLFFNAIVFRPGVFWATAAAGVGSCVLAISFVGSALVWGQPESIERLRAFGVGTICVLGLGYAWIAIEGFQFHAMIQRRSAIGLADPVLTNRFLLWAVMGILASFTNFLNLGYLLAGRNIMANPATVLATSLNGVVNSVRIILIFMPPSWYLQRIAPGRQTAAAVV